MTFVGARSCGAREIREARDDSRAGAGDEHLRRLERLSPRVFAGPLEPSAARIARLVAERDGCMT